MKFFKSFVRFFVIKQLLAAIILICLFTMVCKDHPMSIIVNFLNKGGRVTIVNLNECLWHHKNIVNNYFKPRKTWKTSNLGSVLFKNVDPKHFVRPTRQFRKFRVLIWQHWEWLMNRHVFNFKEMNGKQKKKALENILQHCSVRNCEFTGRYKFLGTVDAVVVHIQKGQIPLVRKRNMNQRWIMLSDESPKHMFTLAKKAPLLSDLKHVFNWTMTYRISADVPVPHGRTIGLPTPASTKHRDLTTLLKTLVPYWEGKPLSVTTNYTTILMSDCVPYRMDLIKQLNNHNLFVDVFGKCGGGSNVNRCPGHYRKDCPILNNYLFYLSLENTHCVQYMTEKIFYNAYFKGAIPVIAGPSLEDCKQLLPPNSFIHVDSFKNVKALAKALKTISKSFEKIWKYHEWRLHFKVVSEDGYFGTPSMHLCRVCEALNYNDGEVSIYDQERLEEFFDAKSNCWEAKKFD